MRNDVISLPAMVRMVTAFFRWWRSELITLLPREIRRHLQYREHQLVMDFSAEVAHLTDCRHGQAVESRVITPDAQGQLNREQQEQLQRLRRRGGDGVAILLAQGQVLALSFPLPRQAKHNLDEVVGYELGRHAPFNIDQVYYGYTLQEQHGSDREIWLSVTVVPKKQVDPLLTSVRDWGFVPVAICTADPQGEPCNFGSQNLLPRDQQEAARGSGNLPVVLLALSALLLCLILVGYPFVQQEWRIAELQQQVEAMKKEAVSVQSMQLKMEQVAAEAASVDEKKRRYPEALDILNALSRILPDDTWLERFEMKGEYIRILGMSADASSLIELLENSMLLQNVTFDSPIVKEPRIDRFRFQIVAEMTQKEQG